MTGSLFRSDWASPPGDTIADLIEERGWDPAAFAARLGIPPDEARALLAGTAPVTGALAGRLARLLGGSAAFWLEREAQFRRAAEGA